MQLKRTVTDGFWGADPQPPEAMRSAIFVMFFAKIAILEPYK